MYSENINDQWKPYFKDMKDALEASTVKGSFGRIGMDGSKEYDASLYFAEHALEIDVPDSLVGNSGDTEIVIKNNFDIKPIEYDIISWLQDVNDIATDADKKACIERLSNG